jgi:hypothetical protein
MGNSKGKAIKKQSETQKRWNREKSSKKKSQVGPSFVSTKVVLVQQWRLKFNGNSPTKWTVCDDTEANEGD